MNLRCVTYVPKFSAGNSAKRDIEIGITHGVVGCGSKVFNASNPGDYVVINGNEHNQKYVVIGILCEKLESCDRWIVEGGHQWPYNWTYRPLTRIFIYDQQTKSEIIQLAQELSQNQENKLNPNCLFNSRFCSKKLKPLVDMLITKFHI
jgi:hypothetical protein